jgi:hypothetical protein
LILNPITSSFPEVDWQPAADEDVLGASGVGINIQGTLAIVPWIPMMPERWRRHKSAK